MAIGKATLTGGLFDKAWRFARMDARGPGVARASGKIQAGANLSERVGVSYGRSAGLPRAAQTHLVFDFGRSVYYGARARAAIRGNLPASSLPDVFRVLPDADVLPAISGMDSVEVCRQPDHGAAFVFCVECVGLRVRDFSATADLFAGPVERIAALDRQRLAGILGRGGGVRASA